MDKTAKRYVLGRTNGGGKSKGGNDTQSFHVNAYFGCVTASKYTNREQWIVEITPKDISSGSPTTQGATSPTTTLSHCGRALSLDAHKTDWQEYYG